MMQLLGSTAAKSLEESAGKEKGESLLNFSSGAHVTCVLIWICFLFTALILHERILRKPSCGGRPGQARCMKCLPFRCTETKKMVM